MDKISHVFSRDTKLSLQAHVSLIPYVCLESVVKCCSGMRKTPYLSMESKSKVARRRTPKTAKHKSIAEGSWAAVRFSVLQDAILFFVRNSICRQSVVCSPFLCQHAWWMYLNVWPIPRDIPSILRGFGIDKERLQALHRTHCNIAFFFSPTDLGSTISQNTKVENHYVIKLSMKSVLDLGFI